MKHPPLLACVLLMSACTTPTAFQRPAPAASQQCFDVRPQVWGFAAIPATDELGGISGIDYDPVARQVLLVTDDRGPHGGAQLFTGSLDLTADRSVRFTLTATRRLMTAKGPGIDAESLRRGKDGTVWWSSEGDVKRSIPPALYRQNANGHISKSVSLPAMLRPDPNHRRGPRDNLAFEGLSLTPGKGNIWIGVESPMIGQGPVPSLSAGAMTTIVSFEPGKQGQHAFAYPLEPIAHQLPGRFADNGLSEVLALDQDRLLVVERSGSQQEDGSFAFVTRLFCGVPSYTATSDGRTILTKQLLARLDELGPFSRANFEGLSFGPVLPDGRKSLLLVSDNNFTAEPTVLLVLALNKD